MEGPKDPQLIRVIVFTNTITNRLRYIADFIGKEIDGKSFELTTDPDYFRNYQGARINYSQDIFHDSDVWLKPQGLLFEKGISTQEISCFELHGLKYFFRTDGDLTFDIFAASFYLISRYEEYLPHHKDVYGRYAHESSIAFKESFLNLPLVNLWLHELVKIIEKKFPGSTGTNLKKIFSFRPTYDIDIAYSYRHKGFIRNAGAGFRELVKGNWSLFWKRASVLAGREQDPFDVYDWLDQLHEQYKLKPYYFFHVGEERGRYDKNISPGTPALVKLIKHHAERYAIGVHPSWKSGDKEELIKKEKDSLARITGMEILSSRQHYLRFNLPGTYRELIRSGIQYEFSMGYGSINGFRASVASRFYWYDLEKEEQTTLQVFPFCFMDANSYYEQKHSPEEAFGELHHYYKKVSQVNGTMITIWHNDFLGSDPAKKGWKEMYVKFIKQIAS